MIPIVFCASLLPCDSAMNPAETIWSRRKARFSRDGLPSRQIQNSAIMNTKPSAKPDDRADDQALDHLDQPGDVDRPAPGVGHRRADQAAHQRVRRGRGDAEVPGDQVPDDRAQQGRQDHDLRDRRPAAISPLPIVAATAVPVSAPTKFSRAARRIAVRRGSTPVLTTVATALAASWNPLM